ncbi:MAG: universal stress protein [Kiloniellaceae bacterium]
MTYRNLLVHIDDGKAAEGRLAAAIALARAHGAHLTGLYVGVDPVLPANLRAEVPPHFLATLRDQLDERIASAEARFTAAVERAGLSADCRTARCPATSVPEVIARHARYADLVILGQREPDERGDVEGDVAEDVVLSSGRPALVIPYIGAGKTLGERVMVAWDAGREAARAVGDAMPMLERAGSVVVLVINPRKGDHGQEPGADISLHLARHGIKVEAQQIDAKELTVADALLSRLADEAIDLLVMGAYGHSRLREWVLGGTTRQIFEQMTVPVLMSH